MTRQWALITGASRGLGAKLASKFWNSGYSLALLARDTDRLLQVASALEERVDQTIIFLTCDLGISSAVNQLIVDVKDRLPRLDVLINNAAIHGPIGPLVGNDLGLWRTTMQVNLLSPVALCQGLIPMIKASGGGSIINLSGGGATAPRANFSAYASAKAALVRFSETLAQEVQAQNIRVNCIAPGAMKTDLLEEVIASGVNSAGDQEFSLAEKIFSTGGASMDKVADLALFLASGASNGISGKLISAVWDNWQDWPKHLAQLSGTDVYTLRRITGRDRAMDWGGL